MLLIQICYLLRKVSRLQIESCNAWKVSVFGVLLVRIFPHSDWIQRDIVRMLVNTDKKNSKYGHFSRSVMREPFFSNILLSMFFSQMHVLPTFFVKYTFADVFSFVQESQSLISRVSELKRKECCPLNQVFTVQ